MTPRILLTKTTLVIAAACLLVSARAQDITSGLVGYWSLSSGPGSSTVSDLSGNGNNGTLKNYADATYNNMWTSSTDPTNGWPFALNFTNSLAGFGTNTYVSIPDSGSLDMTTTNKTWTLAAWVRPSVNGSSEPANAGIISKGLSGAEQFALYMNGGQFTTVFHNAANSGVETVSATNTVTAGTWYHVVATVIVPRQAGSLAEALIYVNGVVRSATNSNTYTTVYNTNRVLTIGARENSSGSVNLDFEGTIDEVRIYDRALTANEVVQLYQNRAFSIVNGGIGFWNGLAGSGGNATLDNTSLNFCTNLYSAPLGTAANLPSVLSVETADALPLGCQFGDVYYANGGTFAVPATNLTIAPGGVAMGTAAGPGTNQFLNNALTYTINSSDNIGIKDGSSPTYLVQSGVATTILTGTNTFSGGLTINSGTVQLGNGGSVSGMELGTASIVTDNGMLAFDSTNNVSFAGAISGNGGVTQKGSGTVTLTGNNSYTNGTTITGGGALSVSSLNDSGGTGSPGTGPINLSGGNILYTGSGDTTVRQFNGTAGSTNSIDVPANVTLTLNNRVTGPGAWVMNKTDTGTLVLGGSADNVLLGMTVQAGTVVLSKTTAGHAIGNPLTVASGATVQMGNVAYTSEIANATTCPVTVNSGGIFDLNGQTENFYSLTLAGNGGGSGALINSAASTTSQLTLSYMYLASAATIGGSGSITLTGIISSNGPLTYAGSGTLELQGQNTYSGGTIVNSGTLEANTPLSLPGNVTVNSGGVLELDDPAAMSPTATLTLPASPAANTVNLTFGGAMNVAALYFGGVAQASGTWGAVGSGATHQNAAFGGSGIINVGGTYWDANGSDAGAGNSTAGGGSGSWDNTSTDWWASGNADSLWAANGVAYFAGTAGTVTLNANETASDLIFATPGYTINNTDGISTLSLNGEYPQINVPAGTTTVGCVLTGGGTGVGLTVNGPGTLVLSGNNNYADGTTINGATLSVNAISDSGVSAIGNAGNVTFGTVTLPSGGTLNFTGASGSTARNVILNGTSTAFLNVPGGSSLALNGQVKVGTNTAPQLLTKTGTGTVSLGGSTDNSSLTMAINQGEVIVTKTSTNTVHGLGGGTSTVGTGTVGNSAELQLSGSGNFDLYSGCMLTVNSPDGLFDLNGQNDSMSTLTLSGAGPYGTGVLINSNNAAAAGLTNGGSGVVLAGNTTVGGNGSILLASKISGAYSLTYGGTATLSLGTAGTYSGGTTIYPGGTVQLNDQSAAGTGTIFDNGTLAVNIATGTLTNTITGGSSSVINIIETSGDNLSLNGPMTTFTGTINCPTSPGGNAKAQIESNCNLPATATINVAAGGTLFLPESTNASIVILNGTGNSEVYGAFRLDGALQTGPVILTASTTIGNGNAAVSTISGSISDGGNGYGITKTATGNAIVLSGTNSFTGPITNVQGTLTIGGGGCLGVTASATNYAGSITNGALFNYASSAAQTLSGVISGSGVLAQSGPGVLTLTGSNTYTGPTVITNGSTLLIGGGGCLGVTATATNYAGNVTNSGTFVYASTAPQTLSGVVSGTGALTQNGPGALTLSGADTYTGATLITSNSTLSLSGGGSIYTTPSISITAGSTLDLSAYSSYSMLSGTTLKASGSGTGATAATIKGATSAGASVTVAGPLVLGYTPQSFNGDATHPALYVSQISSGVLSLSGSAITVSNAAATPLGAGTYSLVQVASGGSINLGSPTVSVTGAGLAAGATASVAVSGNSLNLVVAITSLPVPAINQVTISGNSLIFSGTNGTISGPYYVLTSTNVTSPLSSWTRIATNSFSASGTFSVTNPIGVNPRQFYSIEIP